MWDKKAGGDRLQVRDVAGGRRLYINGVLHTEVHPERPVSGNVWDLLTLPAFMIEAQALRRVLLLGVGGGAAIQALRHFLHPDLIVGVELNPALVDVAQRLFGVEGDDIRLVVDDARAFVDRYDGPPFDLVIDDVFTEVARQPVRVATATRAWCEALGRLVSDRGALAMNFADIDELREAWISEHPLSGFSSHFELSSSSCENVIAAMTRRQRTPRQLRSALRRHPALDSRRPECRLDYRIRRMRFPGEDLASA